MSAITIVPRTLDTSGVDGGTRDARVGVKRPKEVLKPNAGREDGARLGCAAGAPPRQPRGTNAEAQLVANESLPDPATNSVMGVQQFINYLMERGKKSTSESIFYSAMTSSSSAWPGSDGVLQAGAEQRQPAIEVTSRRVGGATYQVPVEVRPVRRTALAMRWLIQFSRQVREHARPRASRRADAGAEERGALGQKREDTHKMAEANKAFRALPLVERAEGQTADNRDMRARPHATARSARAKELLQAGNERNGGARTSAGAGSGSSRGF